MFHIKQSTIEKHCTSALEDYARQSTAADSHLKQITREHAKQIREVELTKKSMEDARENARCHNYRVHIV